MRPGKDGTVLNLSATASVELANDQAVVNFYAMETAPTLLEVMGLPVPPEMTGKSLIQK